MGPIDCHQQEVEDKLEVCGNIYTVLRKMKDNIINVNHKWKAEELSLCYLFPYGVNGLNEERRQVPISPFDYYQYRILSDDTRFQRNDYLFYALSMFEIYRIKSTIATCGKKIEGHNGMNEDVHLYLKNLKGSASYWRAALNYLVAQIRCLGPPTYFLTFSCNDLNWIDMRKALLIADGRPDEDPTSLNIMDVKKLIELYPVIVSRHFMVRVQALLTRIHEVLGGQMKHFWWHIEYQNCGSPYFHMVMWFKNHPSFETEEGIRLFDQVASCQLPPDITDFYELVKKKIKFTIIPIHVKRTIPILAGSVLQDKNPTKFG
ncbi:helitron_like_N domain-containing protein [Trichonephila clavipes]|nr:helitron_like_N domain-containing protein [Trichonephila clavipes]